MAKKFGILYVENNTGKVDEIYGQVLENTEGNVQKRKEKERGGLSKRASAEKPSETLFCHSKNHAC